MCTVYTLRGSDGTNGILSHGGRHFRRIFGSSRLGRVEGGLCGVLFHLSDDSAVRGLPATSVEHNASPAFTRGQIVFLDGPKSRFLEADIFCPIPWLLFPFPFSMTLQLPFFKKHSITTYASR